MQIDHYIEFTNGKDVVRRVPVEAMPLKKKYFCRPFGEDGDSKQPLCRNYQKADKCHECLDMAKKLFKSSKKRGIA